MQIRTCPVDDGVRVEYATAGPVDGEPVLFVHGNGPNWRQFTPQLEAFQGPWRPVALSLRGHGASTAPRRPVPADFSLQRLAGDVAGLLDHLGLDRVHLVGNSLGGLVGFELVCSHPDRIATLVTFGTTAELRSSRTRLGALTATIRLLGSGGIGRIAGRAVTDRDVGRRITGLIAAADPTALRLITRNIATYDYTGRLRTSTVPWLLVRGERDRDINRNLSSTLNVIAARADAAVVDLEGAGHFANLERPEAFNRLVASFLRQHPLPARPRVRSRVSGTGEQT